MATPRRVERVQKQILRSISNIVLFDMKDPRTAKTLTFTKCKVSRDLAVAKVYYSVLGNESDRRTAEGFLEHSKNYIRERLGEDLTTRTLPQLEFIFDPSVEGAIKISETLRELEEEREQLGEPTAAGDDAGETESENANGGEDDEGSAQND